MTNETIYTVNLINSAGKITYSTDFYDKQEALDYIARDTFSEIGLRAVLRKYPVQLESLFAERKYTQTTDYFDGWQLPEKERKVIVDLVESDNGAFCFSEYIYDQGSKLFVDTAIDYIDDYGDDEDFDYTEARAVLQNAFDAGVDIITFYK